MQFSRLLRSSPYLLVESLKSKNIFTRRKQVLDAVHANKLQTALGHLGLFSNPTLKLGEPLPPCYHLVYFTPDALETELGPDGADKTFNPGEPFTRRLWSGGSMSWEQHNPMRLGQTIEEVTTLDRVESKQTRNRKSMIVVTAKKQYSNDTGLCLTDLRSWLFLEPNEQMPTRRSFAPHEILHGTTVGSISATEVTLFRYSALTFNSHKIHYDRVWARDVERQGDLVVHGPLNITLIANAWHSVLGRSPTSIKYRAISPVYVNEKYSLMHDGRSKLWFADSEGRTIMIAEGH